MSDNVKYWEGIEKYNLYFRKPKHLEFTSEVQVKFYKNFSSFTDAYVLSFRKDEGSITLDELVQQYDDFTDIRVYVRLDNQIVETKSGDFETLPFSGQTICIYGKEGYDPTSFSQL